VHLSHLQMTLWGLSDSTSKSGLFSKNLMHEPACLKDTLSWWDKNFGALLAPS
jgi:hypothetical protein